MPVDMDRYRQQTRRGASCLVGKVLSTLDTDLADDLTTLLADALAEEVEYSRLEQYSLEDFGTTIPAGTASRHARGLCKCEK